EGDCIALTHELIERHRAHACRGDLLRRHEDVVRPHVTAERSGTRGDLPADASEPDDSDPRVTQASQRSRGAQVPTALTNAPVESYDAACEREQKGERRFR